MLSQWLFKICMLQMESFGGTSRAIWLPIAAVLALAFEVVHSRPTLLNVTCPSFEPSFDDDCQVEAGDFCMNTGTSSAYECYCVNGNVRSCAERCDTTRYPDMRDCIDHCSVYLKTECKPPAEQQQEYDAAGARHGLETWHYVMIGAGIVVVSLAVGIYILFNKKRESVLKAMFCIGTFMKNMCRHETATEPKEEEGSPVMESRSSDTAAAAEGAVGEDAAQVRVALLYTQRADSQPAADAEDPASQGMDAPSH